MYSDPSLIRAHRVPVNFNDAEADVIDALVKYTGEQKAVLIRNLILEQARMVLSGQADYAPPNNQYEQPQLSLQRAS